MSNINYPSMYDEHDIPHENADNHVESHVDLIESIDRIQKTLGISGDKNSENVFSRLYKIENAIKEFNEVKEIMVSSYADKLKSIDKKIANIDGIIAKKVSKVSKVAKQHYSEIVNWYIQTKKEHVMSIPLNKELIADHSGLYRCEIIVRDIKKNEYAEKVTFNGEIRELVKWESFMPTLAIKPTEGWHWTAIVEYEVEVLFYKM